MSAMNLSQYYFQTSNFWKAILFGPDRKMQAFDEKCGKERQIADKIELWLCDLLRIKKERLCVHAIRKNPHSESFIFNQQQKGETSRKIFVKRFITQLEDNKSETNLMGLRNEYAALRKMTSLNGKYDVYTPTVYGYSNALASVAMGFLEGESLFNILCQSPLSVFTKRPSTVWKETFLELGRWLREVHMMRNMTAAATKRLASKVMQDIAKIETRIAYLEKNRPVDFDGPFCSKLISEAYDLADTILSAPQLPYLTHGDFSLSNISHKSGSLSIVDFATFGVGLPEDDVARLYLDLLNLDRYTSAFDRSNQGQLFSYFYAGYGTDIIKQRPAFWQFHLIKHALINVYMYSKHWGNRQFLNPVLCRLFYRNQKKVLFGATLSDHLTLGRNKRWMKPS